MKVTVPLVDNRLIHIARADQARKEFAWQRVIASINRAEQILARDRHVFRIRGAEVVVTLVGTGAAFDAAIQKHAQRPGVIDQFDRLTKESTSHET